MKTFKLLLPVILNLLLAFILYPIMWEELIEIIDRPYIKMEIYHLRLGLCLILYYLVLFLITVFWLVKNGKKYLSNSVNIRYLVLGIGVTGMADMAWGIFNYIVFYGGVDWL